MRFINLLMFVLLSACVGQPVNNVKIINDKQLQFSGKGAGAGMMLMSAMGPAGIAIGMAIDVGIAKEIAATADKKNISINNIIDQELLSDPLKYSVFNGAQISIDHYGFITWEGEGEDPVSSQLHLTVMSVEGESIFVRYPEDFKANLNFVSPTRPLETIKIDSIAINDLFVLSAQQTLEHLANKLVISR